MNNNLITRIYISAIFLLFALSLSAKTIYYVTATGAGDGSSWTNAANNIQTMIDKAVSGDEVWVAKGTYYPTTETIARDARSATFLLKNGVNLYGGFAGSENNISQRALADLNADGKTDSCEFVNQTILSGDIDGVADVWTKTTNSKGIWTWVITGNENNSYQVVTCPVDNIINGLLIIGGNANISSNNFGGGIFSKSNSSSGTNCKILNCIISNCFAENGGGIYAIESVSIINTNVINCASNTMGGGIYKSASSISSIISNCNVIDCCTFNNYGGRSGGGIYIADYTTIDNCNIYQCSAYNGYGGGIYVDRSHALIKNCKVSNCKSTYAGGGISSDSPIFNCCVQNCYSEGNGGGISGYSIFNSFVSNCSAEFGGGIYNFSGATSACVVNCALSNNYVTGYGSGIYAYSTVIVNNCIVANTNSAVVGNENIYGGVQSNCFYPDINSIFILPTNFIGIATTDAQNKELLAANWRQKEGSPCINAGTSTNIPSNILSGADLDNNPRVNYGMIDIGAYEYSVPKIQMPVSESYNTITSWDNSLVFYNSTQINGGQNINWKLTNQKADFSWETNLTSTYSQPIFTYQIDGTKTSKIYLRYDMYFQAYAGTISPLGTEKLNIEFSKDLVNWSTIATYSNANGTIANQTYKHDISTLAAGKTFFIRFNANGANSNRIEKWEIDNVVIDADGVSAVELTKADKLLYSISDSKLILRNIEQGSYVQLFDMNGKLIDSAKANSSTLDFILPVHGVYILKASSESGITSRKVVL